MEADLIIEESHRHDFGLERDLLAGIGSFSDAPGHRVNGASAAVASYVSLFLLLLVFFTVLFSIASVQEERSRAVVLSLDEAFAHLPSRLGLIPSEASHAAGIALSRKLRTIFKPFMSSSVTLDRVPGGVPEIMLETEKLFLPGSDQLQAEAKTALDRFAVFLQHPVEGERLRVTLHVGPVAGTGSESPGQTMAVARLGEIAEYLFDKGAPPDALAITMDAAPQGVIKATIASMKTNTSDEQTSDEQTSDEQN